jgi:hypothetical protein
VTAGLASLAALALSPTVVACRMIGLARDWFGDGGWPCATVPLAGVVFLRRVQLA